MTNGVIAGIDFGTVRIGIAVCDFGRTFSFPLETYTRRGEKPDETFFKNLIKRESITQFVLGLPAHLNGKLGTKANEAIAFGKWLTEKTGLPVDFVDERYTTKEAEAALLQADMTRKKRKERRDKIAAQILLATFLESGGIAPDQIQGLD